MKVIPNSNDILNAKIMSLRTALIGEKEYIDTITLGLGSLRELHLIKIKCLNEKIEVTQ